MLLDGCGRRTAALSALELPDSPARRLYTAEGFVPLLSDFRFRRRLRRATRCSPSGSASEIGRPDWSIRPDASSSIGAGHNGLVAACYLARAGLDVEVVERDTVRRRRRLDRRALPGLPRSTAARACTS